MPDFVKEPGKPEHGRIERSSIWVSFQIGHHTECPGVGQIIATHREITEFRIGERSAKTS